jgi:anaerobic selenocysteine-containing dehydrogenase
VTISLKTVKNVCPHDCPDTCGMVVTVDESSGRAVKLKGDPDHPFTQGFLCRKVNHYLERVYHPDRLLHPLKRVGPKGTGQFERISWDQAIAEIAQRLKHVIAEHGPQAILPYSYAGTMGKVQSQSLDRRFFHRVGASLLDRTICATAGSVGSEVTLGANKRPTIDPEAAVHARTIINWGSNTAVTNIHFWKIEFEARKRGAKIITIDPHKSATAEKSDWWIPIRPGTDAALALGLMHIIFREGWQDEDYLQQYTLGAADLKARALKEYPPETVARITGLDMSVIETLAREYARSEHLRGGPALIRLNYGLQRHGGGGMAVRTIACLPALTGDWRHPGGGALLSTSKLFPFAAAPLERPDLIPPGTRTINMTKLAEALNNEYDGPPVQALLVYNSNPASIAPDQTRVLKGLAREDLFTVVLEQFLTDTARYADIVLPCTSQLEHWDIHTAYGHLYVQANPPAIAPPGETKPNTEIFRLLGRTMGLEPELFAETDKELAELALDGGRHPALHGLVEPIMNANGPVRLNYPKDYAPYAHGGFGTPEGKCYLYSPLEAETGRDPLPYYNPPHEDPQTKPDLAKEHPLQMVCTKDPAFLNSTFVNIPSLRTYSPEATVELHSTDAHARSIADGQRVTVRNHRGAFAAVARVRNHVPPGTIAAFALRWNADMATGTNVNATTSTHTTDFGAGATFFDCLVEVDRA